MSFALTLTGAEVSRAVPWPCLAVSRAVDVARKARRKPLRPPRVSVGGLPGLTNHRQAWKSKATSQGKPLVDMSGPPLDGFARWSK